MNTINQKSVAKMALLTASLTMGITLGNAIYNEAQATGPVNNKMRAYSTAPAGFPSWSECVSCPNSNC